MSPSCIPARSAATTPTPRSTFERGEAFVRVIRAAKDIPTPPHMRRLGLAATRRHDQGDRFHAAVQHHHRHHLGRADAPAASRAPCTSWCINSITPETERSSHYFWGHARDFDVAQHGDDRILPQARSSAFNEDKDILEAQQASSSSIPTRRPQRPWRLGRRPGAPPGRRAHRRRGAAPVAAQ